LGRQARPVCGFGFFFAGRAGGSRALFLFLPPKFDVFGQAPGTRAVLALVLGWCSVTQLCPAKYANAPHFFFF
jgi:hypothetical protein